MSRFVSALLSAVTCMALVACGGQPETRGVIAGKALPVEVVEDKSVRQAVVSADMGRQILFGDLHVHTTFSPDAFIMSMPLRGGSGLHPPADVRREAIYYARAIQGTTAMINADNVRCEYDENGVCIKVEPCYGDYRTDTRDDCLAPEQQRAWSSPIFVTPEERAANAPEDAL